MEEFDSDRPWHIRVGSAYVRLDGHGHWSLWTDPRKASRWNYATDAYTAMGLAPQLIRFDGIVERRAVPNGNVLLSGRD